MKIFTSDTWIELIYHSFANHFFETYLLSNLDFKQDIVDMTKNTK